MAPTYDNLFANATTDHTTASSFFANESSAQTTSTILAVNTTIAQTITSTTASGNSSIDAATKVINSFMPLVLIVFGSVFNAFIILGMRTKEFRDLSTSMYMTAGAVNDLLGLLIALTAHWLYVNFPETIVRGGRADILCRFFNFYGWGQADVGIVIITAMTADRAYGILRPMSISNPVWRAKVTIAVVIGVCVVKDFHFWFQSDLVDLGRNERMCDVFPQTVSYRVFYEEVWPWIHASFLAVCFVIMLTSNSIIIHQVRTRAGTRSGSIKKVSVRKEGSGQRGNNVPDPRDSNTMTIHTRNYDHYARHVTSMLLAESFTLILLTFPFSVQLVVSSQLNLDTVEKQRTNAFVFP
ncbi:hypothetical protein C0Q70_03906 [Pomacea canaliculata]|uniref:G-protein coupled receptors family 1 profile domain-containing protein n=1 Tax=Pomacea canaliculata TaxID=400727 RepID=A0A2T7PU07_POMCA|nr:uncharacterized protein LOC112557953 [Pomacea canaliculata]XP_025083905.1 uncharacterized protein LOC112557953 [Pomacea canaliculata]XP_025083906.1 uncharacterized protein LOC112557953 [Pomacea canaliculata]PVD36913.1 hypothetical protein C0Q70_03906 [Pomacea canaliculata]